MVVTIIPLISMAQNSASATTDLTSKPRGSSASVVKPQEGAAAVWALTPQSSNDDSKEEPKEEPRRMAAGDALADLSGTRLSILQDQVTERFVDRGFNAITEEFEGQYPSEKELASSVFLQEISGTRVDKKT